MTTLVGDLFNEPERNIIPTCLKAHSLIHNVNKSVYVL